MKYNTKYAHTSITALGITGSLGYLYHYYSKDTCAYYLPHLAAGFAATIAMPTVTANIINPVTKCIASFFTNEDTHDIVKFVDNTCNVAAQRYLIFSGLYCTASNDIWINIIRKSLVAGGLVNLASQIGHGKFDDLSKNVGISTAATFTRLTIEQLLKETVYKDCHDIHKNLYSACLVERMFSTIAGGATVKNILKGGDTCAFVKLAISSMINVIAYDTQVVDNFIKQAGMDSNFCMEITRGILIESLQPYFDHMIFDAIQT